MGNDRKNLRELIKRAKWEEGISYKQLAEYIGINYNSFINYMSEQYELGYKKKKMLYNILYDMFD